MHRKMKCIPDIRLGKFKCLGSGGYLTKTTLLNISNVGKCLLFVVNTGGFSHNPKKHLNSFLRLLQNIEFYSVTNQ